MSMDRRAAGLAALQRLGGPDVAEPVLAAADISPDIVRFALEFAFAEVLARPGLPLVTQELCTVAGLAALVHPVSQLAWHQGAARHVGAAQAQVDEACQIADACRTGTLDRFPPSGILDADTRALVTVAALTALGHARARLVDEIRTARRAGVPRERIVQVIEQMAVYAGFPAALNGIAAAREAFHAAAPVHVDAPDGR